MVWMAPHPPPLSRPIANACDEVALTSARGRVLLRMLFPTVPIAMTPPSDTKTISLGEIEERV